MRLFILLLASFLILRPVMGADTIRIVYNSDWPPYSYGVGDKVQGVLPDLMEDLFVKHLGMKVEHAGFPWVRAQELVKAGVYDAIVTFPSQTRLEYAYSTKNIVYNLHQRPVVAVGSNAQKELLQNPTIQTLSHFRICAMIGDGWSHTFYKKHKIEFQTAKDTQGCLRLVASGRMDVFLHMEAATKHNMRLSNTTDKLVHLPMVLGELPFTLLVSKKSSFGPELIQHFDEMMSDLQKDGRYDDIISTYNDKTYVMK